MTYRAEYDRAKLAANGGGLLSLTVVCERRFPQATEIIARMGQNRPYCSRGAAFQSH
jgi:hypothetical protein